MMKFFDWRLLGMAPNIWLWSGTTPCVGMCELCALCQQWAMSCSLFFQMLTLICPQFQFIVMRKFVTICLNEQNLQCMFWLLAWVTFIKTLDKYCNSLMFCKIFWISLNTNFAWILCIGWAHFLHWLIKLVNLELQESHLSFRQTHHLGFYHDSCLLAFDG